MTKVSFIFLLLTSSFITIKAQAPQKSSEFEVPDKEAIYPGGWEGFYSDVSSSMKFPISARLKGIDGRVFISFVISEEGLLESTSVKTFISLDPDCDREAERAVKSIGTRWTPAEKDGKAIRQLFVVPIVFRLLDSELDWNPITNQLLKPIRTIVVQNQNDKKSFGWSVYGDKEMEYIVTRVLPGDSVQVHGWAPWLYFIKKDSVSGFVSFKSLQVVPELQKMADVIKNESASLEKSYQQRDSIYRAEKLKKWSTIIHAEDQITETWRRNRRVEDSLAVKDAPSTFLRLSSSRRKILIGECSVVDLEFYVHHKNKIPLQFYDLGIQVSSMMNGVFAKSNAWGGTSKVSDIKGIQLSIAGDDYSVYKVFSSAYCPMKPESLEFNPVTLSMLQKNTGPTEKVIEKVVPYTTKPLSISVEALPEGVNVSGNDFYKLVGNFILSDTLYSTEVYSGIPVYYRLSILGEGLTFPLKAPELKTNDMEAYLMNVENSDTIINNIYYSEKSFIYQLLFKRAGEFDYSSNELFTAYNPANSRLVNLKGGPRLVVKSGYGSDGSVDHKRWKMDNIIAIDVSRSMILEDYKPNRLKAALKGLNNFLNNRAVCDIGVMVFSGNSNQVIPEKAQNCYSKEQIPLIDFDLSDSGTAIGNAMWDAINDMPGLKPIRKLVIIGDGDNTAGIISPGGAIQVARKNNVKVYTIGIGTKGKAPFGLDEKGKPIWVENTFSDKDFIKISLQTGGQYYWAKDAEEVTAILRRIFTP